MNGKVLTILELWLLKKFVFLKESVVQNFLKAEVKQNTKTKTEGYVYSRFGDGISRG